MNRERARLSPTKNPAENALRSQETLGRASSLDDEFHDFFDKGDMGDYEGGVAYSHPPSRPAVSPADEHPVIANSPQHKARRAFFARVVGVVVSGCLLLLVTAAQFKPYANAMSSGPGEQVPRIETEAPVAPAQHVIPPREEAQVAAAPAPAAQEPKKTEEPAGVAAKVEVAAPVEPAAPATEVVLPSKVAETTPSAPPKASERVQRPVLAARVTPSAPRRASKVPASALPEISHPVVAPAPVAPKQSVASFPVD